MDLAHALKVALQTGTGKIGVHESLESAKDKKARLLIVSSTCPDKTLTGERKFDRITYERLTQIYERHEMWDKAIANARDRAEKVAEVGCKLGAELEPLFLRRQ